MQPVFNDQDIFNRLASAALSWRDTPFRYRQRCKGRGVDCAFLIAECLREAGLCGPVDLKHYDWDWYACFKDNRVRDLILNGVKRALNPDLTLREMPPDTEPERGDIVAFLIKPALTANHMALMLDGGQFVHANIIRVESAVLDERWRMRLNHVYRLFKELY